ncbi:MAG: leucine-rich repeat domain-containing protein, partial [Clostridia bacterium]|nr:leucine-rich repeat domain-containing protein [Clostridia bacterium]
MKKMKRSLCWLLTLAMLFSMMAALIVNVAADGSTGSAKTDSGVCGPEVTYEYYDATPGDGKPSGVLTIKGTGAMTDYELTDDKTVNTPWVVAGYAADIQKVEVLMGVTTIGVYAFSDLTALETVVIESGLQTIKQYAFRNDKALAGNIALPATTKTIESYAFADCPELLVISTPNTSASVSRTFSTIGNNVLYVYNAAGEDNHVPSHGTLLDGAVTWRFYKDNGKLVVRPTEAGDAVVIPDFGNADATPWSPFAAVIKEIEIRTGITEIGHYAFANLPRVISISIPDTVRYIRTGTFRNATSLPSIAFPKSVRVINEYAFSGCNALAEATAENKFMLVLSPGNERLSALLNKEDNIPITRPTSGTCGDNLVWNYNTVTGELSITGTGSMDSYDSADDVPWSYYTSQIKSITVGEGALLIGKNAFNGANSLKYVTLPSTLTAIETDAFNDCGNIVSAYIDKEKTSPLVIFPGNTDLESKLTYKSSAATPTSGMCGEAVSWRYTESGRVLIISGTGPMYDYDSPSKTPWAAYMTDIETVIVTEGVTTVGKNALNGA